MKRSALLAVVALAFLLPGFAFAMPQDEFDTKAIPLLGKAQEATKLLKLCEKALSEGGSKDFETYVRVVKSHAHTMKKDYDKAEEEALLAIASGRQQDLAHSAMMDVLFARGKYDEGLNICLKRAEKISEDRVKASIFADCRAAHAQKTAIDTKKLWSTYKNNTKKAEETYSGKTIALTGKVSQVDGEGKEGPRVIFYIDDSNKKTVVCLFGDGVAPVPPSATSNPVSAPSSAKDEMSYSLSGDTNSQKKAPPAAVKKPQQQPPAPALTTLPSKGAIVYISGTPRGMEDGHLVLTNCVLHGQ